jgi:hypothetical protein
MSGTYQENKRRFTMHILATLFVLASLGLVLCVIGGMLFAHRERIIEALSGGPEKSELRATLVTFEPQNTEARPVSQRFTRALSPLPLAA